MGPGMRPRQRLKPGDFAVYDAHKMTTRPGPHAEDISPARRGDYYTYRVRKFWVVDDVRTDGTVVLRTRRGKQRIVPADDPRLRRATWWQRIRHRRRFPRLENDHDSHTPTPSA
jgi:hypothetical protein